MPPLKIRNLVRSTNTIQRLICLERIYQVGGSLGSYNLLVNEVSGYCRNTINEVNAIFKKENKSIVDLPIRSRRALQWITYLSESENLISHLDALQRLILYLPMDFSKTWFGKIDFHFFNMGPLYKIRTNDRNTRITVHEAYTQAPDNVLSAFLKIVSSPDKSTEKKIIRDYAYSKDFQKNRTELEYLGIPQNAFSNGETHFLDDSFQRVNEAYFGGKLPKPHLKWSSRITYRKFGHYQWDIDTVMISKTLDQPQIPEYLLDYVMYHELLHKKMGVKNLKGRKIAHTPEFRSAEKNFDHYHKAKRYLDNISKKIS
jgi:hypothetical protein